MWAKLIARLGVGFAGKNLRRALIGSVLVAVMGFYAHHKSTEAKLAKCQAQQAQMARYEAVANRLAEELEIPRDAVIEKLENAQSDCLDADIDSLLDD